MFISLSFQFFILSIFLVRSISKCHVFVRELFPVLFTMSIPTTNSIAFHSSYALSSKSIICAIRLSQLLSLNRTTPSPTSPHSFSGHDEYQIEIPAWHTPQHDQGGGWAWFRPRPCLSQRVGVGASTVATNWSTSSLSLVAGIMSASFRCFPRHVSDDRPT